MNTTSLATRRRDPTLPVTPESAFLNAFFTSLNDADVRYAVLRNYEQLPYTTQGSDIDIIIHGHDAALGISLLKQAVTQSGGVIVGSISSVDWASCFMMGSTILDNGQRCWWGVVIDFFIGGVYDKGSTKLFEMDWTARKKHHDIWVLPEAASAVLGVLKEALRGRLALRYMAVAKVAVASRWATTQPYFEPLGGKALDAIQQIISRAPDSSHTARQLTLLRRSVHWRAFVHRPFPWLLRRIRFELSKVSRYLHPPGFIISIHGVDGVGKTTVIQAIRPVLEAATHRAVFVQHLRPTLLPPLARLKGKAPKSNGPVLDPHGSVPSGPLGSIFRLTYLTLDYILGYWLKTRFIIAKQPAIVVFDRYAYDMALDPRRFRIGLPGWVAAWFARLAPRPDLILCLHANPEVIAARKQELSLAETIRQVTALREFANTQPNAVLISTEDPVDEVRETVLRTLFDFFAKRAAHD